MIVVIEFISTFLLILSLLLLAAVLLKHFKGMQVPAHWVYYLGAFCLLAISSAYSKILQADSASLDTALRFVANLSIFLGSYEIFRRYESRVSEKLKPESKAKAGKRKRRKK